MKNFFFIFLVSFILSGISISATAQKHINSANYTDGSLKGRSIKFIEGIEIKADQDSSVQPVTNIPVREKPVTRKTELLEDNSSPIEKITSLQFKYAQLLNRNVEDVKNVSLYSFIEDWKETRYRYGGSSKSGIDCSAFTGLLIGTVFAIKLPRTAREQYNQSEKLTKEEMLEGDLIFFNTRGGVSHVGVYLGDGYFVHASTNNGVTVSKLSDHYYASRFIAGGRVIDNDTMAICR